MMDKSKQKKMVPAIRFSGFTDDWEQRKLDEISTRVRGNNGDMTLPTLTISAAMGWLNQKERFSGNIAGAEQENYTLLSKGQLSYNHGNSKLAKYGTVFTLENYQKALVPRVYHSFDVSTAANPKFIEYLFATRKPDRELRKLISSGARMDGLLNINYDAFMSITISVPMKEEQERISRIIDGLNDSITLHQRKLENLEALKKLLLQKMFPKNGQDKPDIRFNGFTDDWEQRKVSDIFQVTRGHVLSAKAVSPIKTDSNPYPVYSSQTKNNGLMGYYNEYLFNNAITWTTDGANAGTVNYRPGQFYSTNVNGVLLSNDGYVNKAVAESLDKVSYKFVSHVGNPKLMNNVMSEIIINIPSEIAEQARMSELLIDLDHSVTLHQRKLQKLDDVKRSLLQNMFV